MLSHWYNHDNVGNSLKVRNLNTINSKLDSQNFLKVPDITVTPALVLPQQCCASNTSINSKGSTNTIRDGSPNFRVPWKIVVLGDAGVGKSSLVKQFLNGYFSALYNPTVEDSYLHNINLPDGINQCIEILDTSGFYQFPAMRELNIRLGTAFVLVFDLTKEESLQSLVDLRKVIIKIKGVENSPMVLVGNKSDSITEKCDLSRQATLIANETFKCTYIQSSAKNNINVSKIFTTIVELIMKEIDDIRQIRDTLGVSGQVGRRNSSISFVRRISVSTAGKKSEQSRRFSEPAVGEKIVNTKNNKEKSSSNSNGGKESSKECPTPTSRRKQKNCIIS